MKKRKRKILVIKTGFSELLDRGISITVSLGDVLMCTALLHYYKNDIVTWVTSWEARWLLQGNPYIKKLHVFGPRALKEISRDSYDLLINLEKDIGICVFLSQVRAKKKYGFYFDDRTHTIATHRRIDQYLLAGQENHRHINKSFLEILAQTLEQKWDGQGPILFTESEIKQKYDIGFNYAVGSKWPTKAWPQKHWKKLERLLGKKYRISWQQGHGDLRRYTEWIAECRMLVTSDSLGQAIGQALGKEVITLFGPTHYRRMQGSTNVTVIPSTLLCPFRPCYLPYCKHSRFCMEEISPQKVAAICERLLS